MYFNEVISILRRVMGQSNACIPPQTPTDKHDTGFVFDWFSALVSLCVDMMNQVTKY